MSFGQLAYLVMVVAVFVIYELVLIAAFAIDRLAPAPKPVATPAPRTTAARRPSSARRELVDAD